MNLMGRKSRLKKEKRAKKEKIFFETPWQVKIIKGLTFFVLFCPLIFSANFYFPFVAPKSFYFMALSEIIFFFWLFLILERKEYRPSKNLVVFAFFIFLFSLFLASIFGVDFSRSFWSKPERMTGLLMWLHLGGFFLACSFSFKKISDWEGIFKVSIFVALLISILALLEQAKIKSFQFSDRGGTTLGNTSFLGSYLLFNGFLALWFLRERKKSQKIFFSFSAFLIFLAMLLNKARAASLAFLGGVFFIFLLFLAFSQKSKKIQLLGKISLLVFSLLAIFILSSIFIPGTAFSKKLEKMGFKARFINWEIAKRAFLERPLFGWGPENYLLVFPKYFHPCFFTPKCGGEVWFDRTHNIVFDTLVTSGIFGLLSYLFLFFSFFFVLKRAYFSEKKIDFWTFAIFLALPLSYFVQNLTVFDMVSSLMMFVLILAFGAFLSDLSKERKISFSKINFLKKSFLILIFLVLFFNFIVKPLKTDILVIEALKAKSSAQRVSLYQKALQSSSFGKYQIREFFAQNSQKILRENFEKIPKEDAKKELEFLVLELEKTLKESPLDFRTTLTLGNLYNLYSLFDPSKLSLAEKTLQRAKELSPKNQQVFWALAQTKVYQGEYQKALNFAKKAIELEPHLYSSYEIAIKITKISKNLKEAKKIIEKAKDKNPLWQEKLLKILEEK